MAKTMVKELTDPDNYITFDDIIVLALAKTKSTIFVADPNKWQKVLYAIQQQYKDKIVELKMMQFDESRPNIGPQSEEFYQLINILSASKLISLPNHSFENIIMDDDQKKQAEELEEGLLKSYSKYVGEIAKIIERDLSVKK